MDIDQAMSALGAGADGLPREALQWSLDNWDVAAPRFAALLENFLAGRDRGDATEAALFFIVHLFGEKRQASAFPALCRLGATGEAAEKLLGDAGTGTFAQVLISAFNGDVDPLKGAIECDDADPFIRGAAFDALSYLAFDGSLPAFDMRAYMLELFERMQPRGESPIWSTWALGAANLGYDFTDEVERLCRDGFIHSFSLKLDHFKDHLRETLEDPTRGAGFAADHIRPFEDTIGTLSKWHGFSEAGVAERKRAAERREREEFVQDMLAPAFNPWRDVGRNDPCPCGSGKKYKKCCLV
jgi:hypothetical protein